MQVNGGVESNPTHLFFLPYLNHIYLCILCHSEFISESPLYYGITL
jgi:hypothetical protein